MQHLSYFHPHYAPCKIHLMIKRLDLDFGTIKIYEQLLVSELNEGILFNVENNRKLLLLGREVFQGRPYGYISNRLNSYAVDPMVYRESAEHPELKAIAVVSSNDFTRKSAMVEQSFYNDKNLFRIFSSYEAAEKWIRTTLDL